VPAQTGFDESIFTGRTDTIATLVKGQAITVSAMDSLGWTDQQLAEFTLGIHPGKDYRCC
jgi:hypothetical protein